MTETTQEGAIKFFNEHGYLVINSMRRSGKTCVLRKIIELNEDKRIGILCPSYGHYKMHFNIYPKCEYVRDLHRDMEGKYFDILIGDEVLLQPMVGTKTACAYTNKYIECSLHPTECALKYIADIEMMISSNRFEVDFGQYMSHDRTSVDCADSKPEHIKQKQDGCYNTPRTYEDGVLRSCLTTDGERFFGSCGGCEFYTGGQR